VLLEVSDNGRGFELTDIRHQGGIGLESMRERVEQLGGSLEIFSSPGAGTRIIARIEQVEVSFDGNPSIDANRPGVD
jgi:signal transduction histidine kinase